MSDRRAIIVHVTDDRQRALARERVEACSPPSGAADALQGFADDAVIGALRQAGAFVEVVPRRHAPPTARGVVAGVRGLVEVGPAFPPRPLVAGLPPTRALQLAGPLLPEWRTRLEECGATVLAHTGDYQYLVRVDHEGGWESLPFVWWAEPPPEPGGDGPVAAFAAPEVGTVISWKAQLSERYAELAPVIVAALRDDSRVSNVEAHGLYVRFDAREDSAVLAELGATPGVVWIEREAEASLAWSVAGADAAFPADLAGEGGEGEVAWVIDSGVDAGHPDFAGAVQEHPAAGEGDPVGHGTHVCGILHGLAPGARILSKALPIVGGATIRLPADLGVVLEAAAGNGARVVNASWGYRATSGRYTTEAHQVDAFVLAHPELVFVTVAGNEGSDHTPPSGSLLPSSLQSPGSAKNALTVGATSSSRVDGPNAATTWGQLVPALFSMPPLSEARVAGVSGVVALDSGRGPTEDERAKPDLLAPGTDILSAVPRGLPPHQGLEQPRGFKRGTSMAAPVVTAAALRVRAWYRSYRGCEHPSAALVKATLIGGARRLPGADDLEPDAVQGFGVLDVERCVPWRADSGFQLAFADIADGSPLALHRGTGAPSAFERRLVVTPGQRLTVTLAWTDAPARYLQAELFVSLHDDVGGMWVGNMALARASGRHHDTRNNVQRVAVQADSPGWTVRVTAMSTYVPQGFAVVVTGALVEPWSVLSPGGGA